MFDAPYYKGSEKLKNKVALITGADSGIGRAIAVLFAREGADIVVAYLNEHGDAGAAATINPDVLRKLAHEFGPLQSILIRHEQVLLAQAQQSAVAMLVIQSSLACADGFCGCVT